MNRALEEGRSSQQIFFYEKSYSYIFRKIHKKTPVPESLFHKVAARGLQLF